MSRLASNSLSVSADAIRILLAESEALALESVDKALEAGRLLAVAKDECKHGQWLPFLKRANVAERQAQRMMQLARSGMKSETRCRIWAVLKPPWNSCRGDGCQKLDRH